ncbi:MAG: phosphoribosylformylglycinamidine synthase subunit PurS [Saprospiraceae bacterium]
MTYLAEIQVMPHKELLDPQGKAVRNNLPNVGVVGVQDVRIGKRIELTVAAETEAAAREQVEKACKAVLTNPIMEKFEYTLKQA